MAKKQTSPCKEGWRWQYGESCSAAAWSGLCNTDAEESSPCTEATGYRCACPTVLNWMGRGNTSETTQKTVNHVVVCWLRKTSCRKGEKFQEVKVKPTSFKIIQWVKRKKKKNKRLSPGNQEGNGQLSRSISNDGIIIIQSRAALTGNPSYSNGVNEQHEAVLRSEGGNGRSNMLQGEINAFVPYTSFFFFWATVGREYCFVRLNKAQFALTTSH